MNDTLDLPPIEPPTMPVAAQPAAPEPGPEWWAKVRAAGMALKGA